MNVIKVNSLEEIKEYSSLNCFFEFESKVYTTCQTCGTPVKFELPITKHKLLFETKNKSERIAYCNDCKNK